MIRRLNEVGDALYDNFAMFVMSPVAVVALAVLVTVGAFVVVVRPFLPMFHRGVWR